MIKPRTLKGFRDSLPAQMLSREHLTATARAVFRSFGFSPIDTPALEYSEILLGKGGTESDKQLFRFTDQGNRDVAMRFDLTIPFARFAAQHLSDIGIPFKRYHIATVWRAEKPQKGRYREFIQCDFDTIGTTANAADIETLLVIHDLMEQLGLSRFTIRVNNRLLLNGLLEQLGLTEQTSGLLRSLDKLPKIGAENVAREMTDQLGIAASQAERVLELAGQTGPPLDVLENLAESLSGSESGREGLAKLRELFEAAQTAGLPAERLSLDLSIARGLDYYTGTIYETFLDDLPGIGSVCSGGRYDNLAGLFTSQPLPGVGASLGLDRLLAAMEEIGQSDISTTPAPVLVTLFDGERIGDYLRVGRLLRQGGIDTEVFADTRAIGKQLKYANRRGFSIAIIAGEDEFTAGIWQIKQLQTGEQQSVTEADLVATVRGMLQEAAKTPGRKAESGKPKAT